MLMHSRLEAIRKREREREAEKYVCATLASSHHIRSAIHLFNYLSSEKDRDYCMLVRAN